MTQKAFIINSCEVKTILESEIICNEKIHYMTDKTSYSDNQIFNLDKKLSRLEKILIFFCFNTDKLKNFYDKKLKEVKDENKRLASLFEDENFKKELRKRFEEECIKLKNKNQVN
jgi:predicted DNA-binding ArsR family transcriptional regulator